MAEVTQQQVVEYIKGISVLELSQLVKTLESELGVSAAAAMPMGDADGRRRRRGGAGRREDRVHGHADRDRRQQDQRHQGRPRNHRLGLKEAKDLVESAPKPIKEGDAQGRGRSDQEEVRRGRRQGRSQVARRSRARDAGLRARDSEARALARALDRLLSLQP